MANSYLLCVMAVAIALLRPRAIASPLGVKTLADFIQLLSNNTGTAGTSYAWPDGSHQFPNLDNITWQNGVYEFVPGDNSHNATHIIVNYVPTLSENYADTSSSGSVISSGDIKAVTNGTVTIRYEFDADAGKMTKAAVSTTEFHHVKITFSGKPVSSTVRIFVEFSILERYILTLVQLLKDTVTQFNEPPRHASVRGSFRKNMPRRSIM